MATHVSATVRETPHITETTQTSEIKEADPSREKIEALAEIICGVGEESAAALFVLMGRVQNSADPVALANTTKHFAFTRCGELNLYGMVDAQIAVIESELLERLSVKICGLISFR